MTKHQHIVPPPSAKRSGKSFALTLAASAVVSIFSSNVLAEPPRHANFDELTAHYTIDGTNDFTIVESPDYTKTGSQQVTSQTTSDSQGEVMVRVTTADHAEKDITLNYTIARPASEAADDYSLAGAAIHVADSAGLVLQGTNTIGITVENGRAYTDGGAFNSAIDASSLTVDQGTTTVNASATAAGSPSIAGINVTGSLQLNNNAVLNVNVTTSAVGDGNALLVQGSGNNGNPFEMQSEGIVLQDGATLTTAEGTTLNIEVNSLGATSAAAFATALNVVDGSVLNGTTNATAISNGSYSIGIDVDGSATFAGKTTAKASTNGIDALAIDLNLGNEATAATTFGDLEAEAISTNGDAAGVWVEDNVTGNFTGNTTLAAKMTNAQGSSDTTGLYIEGRGAAHFTGESVKITAESAANRPNEDWPAVTSGIYLFGIGKLSTAENSNLAIDVTSTGTGAMPTGEWDSNYANEYLDKEIGGFAVGVNAEGGTIDIKGNTTVTVKGDGAYVAGMTLANLAEDSDWVRDHYDEGIIQDEDFSLNATFDGDLTITATSEQSGAEGIRLGGYVPGFDEPDIDYEIPQGVVATLTTAAGKTTTIMATAGGDHESIGVYFAYPEKEGESADGWIDTPEEFTTGRGVLNLNGTTIITADHALKGDTGTVNNAGDLTLNGRVDQFKGDFTQTAGSTTLNDAAGGFFGGAVVVNGGTLTAANALWDSNNVTSLTVNSATVSLHTFNVREGTQLSLSGADVTASYFNLADNVSLNANGSSFTLNGSDDEDSRIGGKLTGIANMTVNGGTLDLVEGAELAFNEGGVLTFNNGALFSVMGNMSGGDIVFNDGTYMYEPNPDVANQLRIESGNVTFNGNVGLLTGEAADGEDMTFEKAGRMTSLSVGPNDSSDPEPDPVVTFNGGTYSFDKAEAHAGSLVFTGEAGQVTLGELIVGAGNVALNGGLTKVGTLTISESTAGTLTLGGGELETSTAQIFTQALSADGTGEDAGAVKDRLELTSGKLTFNDAVFNDLYANDVRGLITNSDVTIDFTGTLNTAVDGKVAIEEINGQEGLVYSSITATVDAGNATISKTVGVGSIEVAEGVDAVTVGKGNTVTVVGKDGSLISFADASEGKTVNVAGTLALGAEGSDASGSVDTTVAVENGGTLAVNGGTVTVANTTVEDGSVNVNGGAASFGNLTVSGDATIATAEEAAATQVDKLTLGGGSITITGALQAGGLALAEVPANSYQVNIGTTGEGGKAGKLALHTDTLAGASYFLDPVYVDGQDVSEGSSLKYAGTKVDGSVVVGENSYAVFGSTDDAALLDVFKKGHLTWGNGEGEVLSAVYVAAPITIDAAAGGLKADGTINQGSADKTVAAGAVYFAANSALVADVSGLTADTALITADSVTVEEGSKAVVIGDLKQNIGYMLTTDLAQNQNWANNLVSGNALWKVEMVDGKINAKLQDAQKIYGSLMQGTSLANAGMLADGAAYDYVNALLTDASGNISALPSTAARFDAAMNPAGALTAFTTAYDRASDLREAVREESVKGLGNRLWAHVVGGKTKLDGISSGGQNIDTETNAYGLVVGGEAELANFTIGAALTAGTGKTENDKVDGEDDFDFYGLSVYGKTTVAGFDLLGDISATWLKSDFTIGGVADVDTDTTTAVYSFGVQGEKTFEMSWADITPFIGMDVYHVRSDGFNNGHGAEVDDSDATAVEFPIGARISKDIETTGGFKMAPSFMLAVVPTVADTDIDSKVRFAGAESTYNYTFADDVKIRSRIGLDAIKDNFTFGLRAGYEWGDEERSSVNLQLRAKYAF